MSKDTNPTVGFWMITPSNEFKNGGPMKADLTCHTGPTCLSVSSFDYQFLVISQNQLSLMKKSAGSEVTFL